MSLYQITCINKAPRDDQHHSIKFFGGLAPDGSSWKASLDELLTFMKANPLDRFYTAVGNAKAYVHIIPASWDKREHVRTIADNTFTDNLLALPECR